MNDLFNKYKQILSGGVSQTANKLSNFLSRGKVSMQGTNQTSGLLQNPQVQAFTSPILNELKRVVPSANKVTQFSAGPGMAYALMGKKDAIPKLSEIGDTVKLGLMAGGAYAAPAAIGLGTALGAGLKVGSNIQQRKPIAEDLGKTLGEGVVSSAPYAGLFGLTSPVTQKVASFAGSKFSSPIASRITSGLANLGEGAVNTSALGGKYGALDAALDFGSGLVGTNIRGVSAERSITDGRLSPETLDELTRAEELLTKKVKDFGFGTRLSSQAKLKVKQMQDDAIETIDRIAGEYLPDNVLEKVAGNPLKTLKAIVDQHSSTGTGIKKINPLSNLVEEPLVQEARKYKSAEEFIKAQGDSLYHGTLTGNKFETFDINKSKGGIGGNAFGNKFNQGDVAYFTKDYDAAKVLSKVANETQMLRRRLSPEEIASVSDQPYGEVLNFYVKKGSKIAKVDRPPSLEVVEQLKRDGFDGVEFSDKYAWAGTVEGRFDYPKDDTTVAIWNTDKIVSKPRLENMWKEANDAGSAVNPQKSVPGMGFVSVNQQARKYKSADEFVKAQGTPVYHGANSAVSELKLQIPRSAMRKPGTYEYRTITENVQPSISLSENGLIARKFSLPDGVINEVYATPKKTLDLTKASEAADKYHEINDRFRGSDFDVDFHTTKDGYAFLKKNGYDSIRIKARNELGHGLDTELRIFDPSIIKTRSQLEDIWNQANKTRSMSQLQKNIPGMGFASVNQQAERTGDVLVEARSKIKSGVPSRTTNIKQTLKDLYTDWVNRFYPVEDLVSQVEKKGNFSIRPEVNPKYQIKRLMGSGAVAELRHMKELNPILSELGEVPSADFDVFLKAKRDIGFSSAGRAVYGSDPVEAQKIVTALSQKYDINQLESVASKLYEYQDKGLQMLIDNGFINAADAASMKAANPDYVPFQRVMGELDNYLGLPTNKLSQGTNPIQKIKGSDRDIYSPVESIIANTYKMEAAISKNNVAKSIAGLSKIDEGLGEMIKQVPNGGENTFPVWIDGKKQFYTAPEDILRVIKGLNEEGMGTITKILSAPARLLRQGATGSNIDFMIPNIFKDQFDAAINAKYGYTPFVDYMRGLAHLIKYERGGDALVEDWINSGGKIFFENMAGRKSISQQVSDSLDKKTALQRLGNFISGTFKTVGNYSENPTRIGLYKRALDATGNKLIAATESREGTLDFGRMGAKMKAANAVIPFLNVGVQGFDKLIRTVKNNPKQTAVRMGIYAVAPATMAAIYNNMFHPEEYASIPQYEKDDNFILITGKAEDGSAQYVTFPKGNVLPMIANPVENFITYLAGNNPQGFKSLALQLLGDTLPVVEGGDDFRQAASRTIGSNTPAAFKPLIESVANYNFFKGKPIVPGYLQSKAPSERVKESTPGIYKYLGGVVNQSPLQVQNFTEGTLAGFAKMPINIADTVMTAAAGEKVDVNKIPIVRRFIAQGDDPQTVAKYKEYEQRDKEKQAVMKGATPPILDRILNIKGTKASSVSEIKDPSVAKFKVEKTGEPVTSDGIYYYKNKETGKIDSVKLDREIKQPVVTGNEIVDKERQAKYKRDLTAKKNDILEQMEIGLLTPSQAEKKINQLQASQKITFPAIPKLTGNSLLDKENVDEFVGKLTEIKNSIVKQNAIGTISDKEAEAKLSQLTLVQKAIRAKVSTKKVKTVKLKIPKAKIRKIKVSVLKAPKQYKLKKVRLKTPVLKKTKLT